MKDHELIMCAINGLRKRYEKLGKNFDEDSASQEITGEYKHYKTEKAHEKALAEYWLTEQVMGALGRAYLEIRAQDLEKGTNREWIHKMTDEELADFMMEVRTDARGKLPYCAHGDDGWLEWLKRRHEDGK